MDKLHTAIGALLVVFAVAFCGARINAAVDASSLEDRALASTVYVGVGNGHGSGFVLAKGRILTARHVVEGADTVTIKFHNSAEIAAKVLWKGEGGNDVALLEADTRGHPALPLACEKPTRGDPVMIFGHPKFLHNIATYGKVAGFVTEPELLKQEADAVVLDAIVAPGNSGGPVIDQRGYVIGLANAMILAMASPFGGAAGTGHTVMLPSGVICGLLNR